MKKETKKAAGTRKKHGMITFRNDLIECLENKYHTSFEDATPTEMYKAVATVVNQQLLAKRWDFNSKARSAQLEQKDCKKIYYISMEFLMGQSLKNNLYNLGETEMVEEILKSRDMDLEDLYNEEPDAGLGNGGLGRLAACYLSALTTCGYDVTGFSLRYEYGLFRQKLIDGWQAEMPDNWLPGGRVWLNPREDETFKVSFYGNYHEYWTEKGLQYEIRGQETVEAVPYDMYISGPDSKAVGKLRLWRCRDSEGFDMASFNSGDFTRAAQNNNKAELITKVLYPADNIEEGKELRLKQQYFMVSASCQNVLRDHFRLHRTLDNLADKVAIHINDTHPALCIPEMMRLLMDEYGYAWDKAWEIVHGTVAYTNHTVLAEALEKWKSELVHLMMPRIYVIIEEIDRRFREEMEQKFPGDTGKINYMAPLGDSQVRMANLSIVGSHSINGVSGLHSDILKEDIFHDFYLAWPEMFTNVTNGIAYRRWLCQSNPGLASLIDDCIGTEYRKKPAKLGDFIKFREDKEVIARLDEVKRENKARFSDYVKQDCGVALNPDAVFITQAKRLHEYKRQLLNALHIISRYNWLKENPNAEVRPEVYLFGAKTAPNYYVAKEVIQLIWSLGEEIRKDKTVADKLQVLFLENYRVSMAEKLMPATDNSEQISLAGKEASGTGNMKMMINGAVTIGTMDGANVEMYEAVGEDNIFIFGQRADEVSAHLREGYDSRILYQMDRTMKAAVDRLSRGFNGHSFEHIKDYLLKPTYSIADPYMCLYDFEDYCRAHQEIREAYTDRARWGSMSITNIAKAERFAADRAVKEYADRIWHTKAVTK